jgi:hypothetical protein
LREFLFSERLPESIIKLLKAKLFEAVVCLQVEIPESVCSFVSPNSLAWFGFQRKCQCPSAALGADGLVMSESALMKAFPAGRPVGTGYTPKDARPPRHVGREFRGCEHFIEKRHGKIVALGHFEHPRMVFGMQALHIPAERGKDQTVFRCGWADFHHDSSA